MSFQTDLLDQLSSSFTALRHELPRYQQLYELLRQYIVDSLLLPGSRLPSSRVLAKRLGIARNTVLAAIERLCAEGYAVARSASGIYILPTQPETWNITPAAAPSNLTLSERGQRISQLSHMPVLRGAFTPGIPDIRQFPFELWQRYLNRYARNPKLDWQSYPQQGGHTELRGAIAAYLRTARGIQCDKAQVLITHGTQYGLRLVAELLADFGDPIWVENPGYPGARCVFDAAGLNIIYQPVDAEGLSPPATAWQQTPRFIYTTPSHQYPLGVVMSATRRRHLIDLAARHQSWLIEDDYDSEYRYVGTPLAALHALAPQQVIYLGTFSKTLFPALRIGYMVLPENLVDAFRATQARHYREPSYILQNALADFIRDGHVSAHIRKMRREYQARRDLLLEVLQCELGNTVQLGGFDTGLHMIMHLPAHISDEHITDKAYQQGVITRAVSKYYVDNATPTPGYSALLLGFGDAEQQDIMPASKVMMKIILDSH